MQVQFPLTCILIGETGLLPRCAKLLIARAYRVLAIVIEDAGIEADCPVFSSLAEAMHHIEQRPDLLFSIANRTILSPAEISFPRIAAVNYHDSLLPAYAGVNAPSWAILRGESSHGISWHRVSSSIDGGHILVQREFCIDADESALSLSIKCVHHALQAFVELLDMIENRDLMGTPQDLSRRSYFSRSRRLPRQGILRWSDDSASISRFVRAAHLGPYPNDFGLPKVLCPDGTLLIVGSIAVDERVVHEPCGTVVDSAPGLISVVAGDGVIVRLGSLLTLYGRDYVDAASLVGLRLGCLDSFQESLIAEATAAAVEQEDAIRARMSDLPAPFHLAPLRPFKFQSGGERVFRQTIDGTLTFGQVMAQVLQRLLADSPSISVLLGLHQACPVGFMAIRPLTCHLASQRELAILIDSELASPAIPADLPTRFPELSGSQLRMRSISVCLSAEPNPPIANPGLLICCSAGMLSLRFEATQIDEVDAARLASYLLGNAESLPPRCLGNTYQWRSVPRQITEQTRRDPGAIALEFGSELLTYAELDRRVNLLVSQLLTHGAGCEQRYALLLPQGIEFPIAALAVLRAGASYIPLDPSAPLHQLNRILKDACPLAILTLVSSQPLAEQLVCPVLYLDVDFSPGTSEVHSLIAPDDLAYVIYTSGSTGEPKGCMIEHRALSWLIEQSVSRHGIGPGDRVLQLCAVSFDASVEEIFTAWCAGATLVVRPPSLLESAESYLDFCEMAGLTIVGLYVSLLPDILRAMEQRGRFPATVRIVTTGGEIVPAASVERWRRFFADAGIPSPRLLNVYGLTETTVANLLADLTPESDLSSGVPIGAPLPGTRFRIAPDNLAAPSPGDVGELLLSGPQLARGYWSRPALTALRFVWDPSDGTRWFRTGDLVRISPSGALIVVGRSDRQVQLNGIRVELEGIERELQAHPSVSKAVVVCSQLPSLHPLVVAYWVPRPDHSLPPNSLRQFIADRLPAHAVPAAFVKLEALPLTPNGKIDHKALPFPTLSVDQQKRAAPSTYLERQLHGLWAEVLGRDDFGVTDNFFLVGGHSLSSARLSALIEEQLGRRLPLSVLFQRPTVKELSQWLESSNTPASFSGFRSLVTLQNRGEAPPLFVVHGGDGDVYIHLPLARCLAPHRPVYGLQAVGFDGSAPRHRSVAEMAAHYADEILRFQPSGPYHLLGYSGGGWYAWAVAAELHRRGATLGLIGLVDTGSTADLHRRLRLRQLVRRQLQQLPRRARSLAAADLSDWPAALNRRLQALQFITWTLLRSQGRPAPQALNPTASPKPTQPIRGDYFLQLHTYYRPPRLPLRADVFASCSQINHLQKLWNFYAQGLAVVHPCMENHVDYYNVDWMNDFAHQLESVLTRIESGSSS